MPTTEAGKRLLRSDFDRRAGARAPSGGSSLKPSPPSKPRPYAAERERIRAAVEGLPGLEITLLYSEPDRISRAAVLTVGQADGARWRFARSTATPSSPHQAKAYREDTDAT